MTIDTPLRAALFARESDAVVFALLTFDHADLDEPIRLCANPTQRLTDDPRTYGTISRGDTYTYVDIALVLPEEGADAVPRTRLELDNADQSLTATIRSIRSGATMEIEMVSTIDVDAPFRSYAPLTIRQATTNRASVSLVVQGDLLTATEYPSFTFNSAEYPALF